MSKEKEKLFKKLSDAVVNMDEEETVLLSKKVVVDGYDAYEAIDKGLADGMDRAGKLFEYAGLDVLKPHIRINNKVGKHRVVIGVVEGDTHDIGKNLVKIMLESAGFEVFDLGRDIPPIRFVEKAEEVNAKIIALSTLMTTTMDGMAEVINILNRQKIRDRYKVMVGGGPISQRFADKIGADGYSANAAEAVRLARRLVGGADCAS